MRRNVIDQRRWMWTLMISALAIGSTSSVPAQTEPPTRSEPRSDPAVIAFFESTIRPILAERCHSCHGPTKQKAGLRLDTKAGALEHGGDSGPPVIPGQPDESLLIEAIGYDSYIQMPPTSKLPDEEIAALTDWIAKGAPWPSGPEAVEHSDPSPAGFDLEARANAHWSFQPVRRPTPPEVQNADWCRTPIDRFLLARLEEAGIPPSPDADRRTVIRRLSFDLTGLPPSPEQIENYLRDDAPGAFDRLVDRLLASPHYGERWARHWLDLVRFAETSGHEFDYDILTAHRYRDYVIRAFNDDLPYDQFVVEHIAGDLLERPRRHPTEGTNESILGTMFYFLAEGTHSPVDIREDLRNRVHNQIDVLSKTFLGLTVACARCHDHKFDAISTRDYYALAGYVQSTRHQYAFIDPPDRIDAPVSELESIRTRLKTLIDSDRPPAAQPSLEAPGPRSAMRREGDVLFEDFSSDHFDGWYSSGQAFGDGPTQSGEIRVEPEPEGGIATLSGSWAHSGAIADRLYGVLRSRTFTIEHPYVHLLAAGTKGRINVVIDGFEKIRSPIYGGLTVGVDHGEQPRWVTIDLGMWQGHRAYLELSDGATARYTGSTSSLWPGDGSLSVGAIVVSDHQEPPGPPGAFDAPPVLDRMEPDRVPAGSLPLLSQYRAIASTLPEPTLALAAAEGTGIDVPVHIRGSTKNLGDVVPRRFLEAFDPEPDPAPAHGSGRLDLARHLTDPDNPLTARVLVNRLWAHHFGVGLVATPDDFGNMGQPPSHPKLLDWLADEFVRSGWSIKHMHRLIVSSHAYRMDSRLRTDTAAIDPTNALLHRMNVRRLEAEAIRDAILAVSGEIDSSMFGPSVLPHLTPFMEGRGRPRQSGPLDGNGRRSLYINVRRNFLTPFFLAFDYPAPATTMGRRTVSNVPAQALALMNDPFVIEQARAWANRALADPDRDSEQIIDHLYVTAFGRFPTVEERDRALAFLEEQGRAYGDSDGRHAWADLCHMLFNSKEFIYIN